MWGGGGGAFPLMGKPAACAEGAAGGGLRGAAVGGAECAGPVLCGPAPAATRKNIAAHAAPAKGAQLQKLLREHPRCLQKDLPASRRAPLLPEHVTTARRPVRNASRPAARCASSATPSRIAGRRSAAQGLSSRP
eukprot:350692-Chlamydomonas_euryale.AAC.3